MRFDISEDDAAHLDDYARIPISFMVQRVFDVVPQSEGHRAFDLSERALDSPYEKDYDALESPLQWPRTFAMANWVIFAARSEGMRIGGAVVALRTAGLEVLEGRQDLAVLWDIRVTREVRRKGVGAALFATAEAWAAAKGCRQLKVETQNINVPACKFYARQGCVLGAVHPFAYPELPLETQLFWYKDLASHPDHSEDGRGAPGGRS